MNTPDAKTRKLIIRCFVEGQSIRATARTADVSKNTVTKLLIDAGKACTAYQDRGLRDLPCRRIQIDEIWSFIYAKEKNVARAKSAPPEAGDVWTWTAIDAETKLVPSWRVGDRSGMTAIDFMDYTMLVKLYGEARTRRNATAGRPASGRVSAASRGARPRDPLPAGGDPSHPRPEGLSLRPPRHRPRASHEPSR